MLRVRISNHPVAPIRRSAASVTTERFSHCGVTPSGPALPRGKVGVTPCIFRRYPVEKSALPRTIVWEQVGAGHWKNAFRIKAIRRRQSRISLRHELAASDISEVIRFDCIRRSLARRCCLRADHLSIGDLRKAVGPWHSRLANHIDLPGWHLAMDMDHAVAWLSARPQQHDRLQRTLARRNFVFGIATERLPAVVPDAAEVQSAVIRKTLWPTTTATSQLN